MRELGMDALLSALAGDFMIETYLLFQPRTNFEIAGLVRRVLDGHEREFLAVEYEGGAQVFVPVFQADRAKIASVEDRSAPRDADDNTPLVRPMVIGAAKQERRSGIGIAVGRVAASSVTIDA